MSSISGIRIKNMGELLLPPNRLSPNIELKFECVDLTNEICMTPVSKNILHDNQTRKKQSKVTNSKQNKDPTIQTKLDAFFKSGSHITQAPKKFKKMPASNEVTASTPASSQKPRRNLEKLSLRRNLLKSKADTKDSELVKSIEAKSNEENLPSVIPGVIDLCSDSDTEGDTIVKLPLTPKRSATVKSEKSICPSYKVIEGTTFAVDGFKYGRIEGVTVYFLTHFHADHYIGLTKKFSMPIYVSKITANLLREFIPINEKLVNILHLNSTIVIDGIQITAIDANHCPGAIMLLFQLPCGKRILHTGDFRASLEMELNPHLMKRNIDILYLDTTYISNKYSFQSQAKSISDAIQIIREFKEKNEGKRILFVCGAYLVGKEKFWSQIAKAFDFKVWTDDKRRKILRAIDNDEILQRLVVDAREADLHVISMMKIGYRGIFEYWKEVNCQCDMLLAIRPSGWEKNSKPQYRGEINIIGVEYSEHSSHDEMRRFVGFLKPNEVISTVPLGKDLTICGTVPLSWYKKEHFSPIKKQSSIFDYLEVVQR